MFVWERFWQPRCRSLFERAQLLGRAPRWALCDNHDATFESITFSYIGILCGIYNGEAFWQSWCRSFFVGAVCLVALRDGRCDNNDAYVSIKGEVNATACRLSFERA